MEVSKEGLGIKILSPREEKISFLFILFVWISFLCLAGQMAFLILELMGISVFVR